MGYMTITPTIFHTNSDNANKIVAQNMFHTNRGDIVAAEMIICKSNKQRTFPHSRVSWATKRCQKKTVAVTEAFPTHQWLTVWRDDHNPWQPSSCLSWPPSGLEHPPTDFPVSQSSRKKVQDGDEAKHGENDEDTRVDWQSTAVRESELEWVDQGNRGP